MLHMMLRDFVWLLLRDSEHRKALIYNMSINLNPNVIRATPDYYHE